MIELKLMPDYQCYPLWGVGGDNLGNIDPNSLPISEDLKLKLAKWANQYDATLNLDDPLKSGFSSEKEELSFRECGEKLLNRLQIELGSQYVVYLKI